MLEQERYALALKELKMIAKEKGISKNELFETYSKQRKNSEMDQATFDRYWAITEKDKKEVPTVFIQCLVEQMHVDSEKLYMHIKERKEYKVAFIAKNPDFEFLLEKDDEMEDIAKIKREFINEFVCNMI